MHAEEIADLCLAETGAGKVSRHAREVAYVAMVYAPTGDMKRYRRQIRDTFKRSGEYGSVFMILILPILISLISNWLVRWLWSTPTTARQIRTMRLQAYASLTALSPAMTATLTSTSTPEDSPGKPGPL
jgi:hypothetical protein